MTCPAGPLPSNEWTVWLGPVPTQLTQFAVQDLSQEAQHPYGYEWTTVYDGQQVMAIKQHHTWTYHNGKLVTGICIPGITLYRPKKVGAEENPVDLSVPNSEVAWFDDGDRTHWNMIAVTAIVVALIIAFFFAMHKMGKKAGK